MSRLLMNTFITIMLLTSIIILILCLKKIRNDASSIQEVRNQKK